MQLELKHLAVYLPYKLKILNGWGDIKILNYSYLDDYNNGVIVGIKPVLRPLDLTKEVEHNGERFVPIKRLSALLLSRDNSNLEDMQHAKKWIMTVVKLPDELPYFIVQNLLSWHFDIYGLIDAGLAIDINTLNETK